MSNTVFSLGYIVLLSLMMSSSKLFLNFNKARETLKPILQKIIIPYILIEVLAQITFQIPCFRDLAGTGSKAIPQIIGLTEYYTVEVGVGKVPTLRKTKGLFQLWLKALVYFLVSIYIQIIESSCFNKLEQLLTLGKMKGQAVTYLFNNLKIKQYQKYQESNFKREQMMLSVKEKCDRWRDIFENQARQDEQKLGLLHNSNRQVSNEQELEHNSNNNRQKEKTLGSDGQKPVQNNFGLKVQAQPQVEQSNHDDQNDTKKSQISENERKKSQKVERVLGSQKAQAKENIIGNINNEKDNQHRSQRIINQNKQVQSKDERTLYSEMNFEFLVVKKLDEMKQQQIIKALEEQQAFLNLNSTSVKKQDVDFDTIDQDLKQNGEISIYFDLYKYKLKRLNCFVLLYLKLRTSIVNPVLLLNNKKRVQSMLDNVKKGETITRSSIENAIIADIQSEVNSGLPTNEEVSKRINASRMISKISFLFLLVVWTNLDIVTYLFMISYFAFVCPGLATVIYPLSIFGFGILYETGPPKMYWHFIMGYTQLLIFIEFSLSLAWSIQIQLGGVGLAWLGLIIETLNSYQEYTGIYLVESANPLVNSPKPLGATELWMHFAPKITITCLVMLLIQNEIALDIFEQKEPQKEKIEEAYIRYIKGQYNVEIKALQGQNQNELIFKNLTQEFDEWIAYYMQGKAADDFDIRYYQNDDLNQQALDMKEIY